MEFIKPNLISLFLTIFVILMLIIGLLIGFRRGIHKSLYRLIVSVIFIFGLILLIPTITNYICDLNLSKLGVNLANICEINKTDINSINDVITFYTGKLLNVYDESNELINSSIVLKDTTLFQTISSLVNLVFTVVILIIGLILNYTLFRFIFFICFKKVNKNLTIKSKLIGSVIGLVNMFIILLMICTPLSGVFSVVNDVCEVVNTSDTITYLNDSVEEKPIKLSIDNEVITINNNLDTFNLLNEYKDVYRNSLLGKLYSIKINGVEIDNHLFDMVFKIKVKGYKVSIRKEISIAKEALKIISDEINIILKDDSKIIETLANISNDKMLKLIDEISKLKVIDLAFDLAFESSIIYLQNDEMLKKYISVNELVKLLNEGSIDFIGLTKDLTNVIKNVQTALSDADVSINCLFDIDTIELVNLLLKLDTTNVTNIIDSISSLKILDILADLTFTNLEKMLNTEEEYKEYIMLKPHVSSTNDNMFVIDDNITNILYSKDYKLTISPNLTYVINDIDTNIKCDYNMFYIKLSNVKLTEEIQKLSNLYKAIKELNIKTYDDIINLINASDITILNDITYEKLNNFFNALLDLKLVNNHLGNLNIITNKLTNSEFTKIIRLENVTSDDLTSLTYCLKILLQTNIKLDDIDTNNYQKLSSALNDVKEELSKNIVKCSLFTENISEITNYLIKMFNLNINIDFSQIDFKTEGEKELLVLFNALTVILKHLNVIKDDFYSISDSALDEICNVLNENIKQSKLIKSNMNSILSFVKEIQEVKELGIEIVLLEDDKYTEEEISSIFETLKLCVNIMKDAKNSNLLLEVLKIDNDDIDTLLKSKFITTNVAHNLVLLSEEGNVLDDIIVNIDKTSDLWFDEVNNGVVTRKGELRKILENAKKLTNSITTFDKDDYIEIIIKNLCSLNNNFNDDNDEIKDLLSSKVITDTLIHYIDNLSDYLDKDVYDNIIIKDVNYLDGENAGELRKLIKAFSILLIDSDNNVIINEIIDGNLDVLVKQILNTTEDNIDYLTDSKIILDTIINFLENKDFEIDIVLQNKQKDYNYYKKEIKKIITGAKLLLLDEENNIIDLQIEKTEYINMLVNKSSEDINTILDSEIINDTIAFMVINLSKENDIIKVSDTLMCDKETYDSTYSIKWREELVKAFNSLKIIITDDEGSNIDKLISSDIETKIDMIFTINEEDIDTLLASTIITDTISNVLIDISNDGLIVVSDEIKAYDTENFRQEIKSIITAGKILLYTNGNSNYDILTSNDNVKILNILLDITDEDILNLTTSKIIVDTVKKIILDIDSTVVITDEVKNYNRDNWKNEISSLIKALKTLLVDGNNKLTDKLFSGENEEILSLICNLTDSDVDIIINSNIIYETIKNSVLDISSSAPITFPSDIDLWEKTAWSSEIKSIIKAINIIACSEVDGEKVISLNKISDQEKLLQTINSLSDNDLDTIFNSIILLQTFYHHIKNISSLIQFKEQMDEDKDEAIKFIKAVRIITMDINSVDELSFNFDKFLNLNDTDIDTVLSSTIIKYSSSKIVLDKIKTTSLNDYILIKGENDDKKVSTIENDLKNLLIVLRDLNVKHNISYDEISYDAFKGLTEEKADEIAIDLLKSNIIVDSIEKFIGKVLSDSLDEKMYECVDLKMDKTSVGDLNYWLDNDINNNGITEENEIGEFRKLFRLLGGIEKYTSNDISVSDLKEKNEIAKPLKQINHSKVLHNVLAQFLDKALNNVKDWRYKETDLLYVDPNTFTIEMWDVEINIIANIISLVNNEDSFTNLSQINVTNENYDINKLEKLLVEIAKSRILDISNIENYTKLSVNLIFFNTVDTVTVSSVYDGNDYNDKVNAWNDPIDGEIEHLMNAIMKLRNIKSVDFNDKTLLENDTNDDEFVGVENGRNVGIFLNSAKESKMLRSVIVQICEKLLGDLIVVTENMIDDFDFEKELSRIIKIKLTYL